MIAAHFTLILVTTLAADPVFIFQRADGKPVESRLLELSADWSLRLDKNATIAAGDFISMRRPKLGLPPMPEEPHVVLTNGDRIPATQVRLDGEKIRLRHPDLNGREDISIPLGFVALYWQAAPSNAANSEALRRRLLAAQRKRDVLLLQNGDTIEGTVNSVDGAKIGLEADRKQTTIDQARVAVITLNSGLAERSALRGPYARLTLTDGTRLSLTKATCTDGTTLAGTTTFGATVRVPVERIAALDVLQGKAVYLSDLKPASYEAEPYLDLRWPLGVDSSAGGKPLRLADGYYDKGLGTHPRCRVAYRLDGAYKRFSARVGFDPALGRDGSVRLQVLADGKPLDLGIEGELAGRDAPVAISADVAGVKELTLVVDFGRRGDVQAHLNWVDARLVK